MATLNWIGKEAVVNHDKEVPFKLLKKVKSASVGTSQNLIVHGDNLEALKALMPYYVGKIKCIYIDPPYNTGNEGWVYNDKVNSPKIKQWLGKVVGRESEDLTRHDKWLCMMYPRLNLLRDLLADDGAIFVSIDDNEVAHLRLLMDEIFLPVNFIAEMVWEGAFKNDARQIGVNHEYVLVYAKKRNILPAEWAIAKEGVAPVLKEVGRLKEEYKDNYDAASKALAGWFRASKATPSFAHRRFRYIDERGAYKEDDPTAPGGRRIELKNPKTGKVIQLRSNRGWAFDQATFNQLVDEGRISFVTETSIMVRRYLHETDKATPQSVFYQPARSSSERLSKLLGSFKFEFPKDELILKRFIEMATDKDSLVLDSFAGSGTTAHAVLDLNKEDGGNRKFIMVEMEDKVAKDITAERVKRAIEKYDYKDGFEYCELDKALFDENGQIEDSCDFKQFATYIYFTETQTNIDAKKIKGNFIGALGETEYYLLYKGKLQNDLDKSALKIISDTDKKKVIYADRCLLDDDILAKHNIVFKQIPYEVKVY